MVKLWRGYLAPCGEVTKAVARLFSLLWRGYQICGEITCGEVTLWRGYSQVTGDSPTHPPYQLIPHTNSTPVHTWVDQLIPSHPTAITTSSPRPSIPYQLIPSHRPSVTNSSPTHDYIVSYLTCFIVRHTGSQRLLILWECNKKRIYYSKQYILFKKTYNM